MKWLLLKFMPCHILCICYRGAHTGGESAQRTYEYALCYLLTLKVLFFTVSVVAAAAAWLLCLLLSVRIFNGIQIAL